MQTAAREQNYGTARVRVTEVGTPQAVRYLAETSSVSKILAALNAKLARILVSLDAGKTRVSAVKVARFEREITVKETTTRGEAVSHHTLDVHARQNRFQKVVSLGSTQKVLV